MIVASLNGARTPQTTTAKQLWNGAGKTELAFVGIPEIAVDIILGAITVGANTTAPKNKYTGLDMSVTTPTSAYGDSLARSPGTSTPARLRSAPPDLPRRKEPSAGGVLGARRNLRVSTRPRRCTTRHRFLGTELPSALLMRPINKNGGRLRLAEFSRTQHSRIPGYCQILQNLRNSGVTAARSTIIPNQVY